MLSARHAQLHGTHFCRARVKAEMSKDVVYTVDVKLDEHGIILETQCECGAGSAPSAHCKHVGVILYGLSKLKHGLIVSETCTQVLQTFHKAKKFKGSPVKLRDLSLRKKSKFTDLAKFDPRPAVMQRMAGYSNHFRNVVLNSSACLGPIKHLYPPANVYGVANDHDYCGNYELHTLKLLRVSDVSVSELDVIEQQTRGQASNNLWKQERCLRLQASVYGKICKSTSPEKLAESLMYSADITSASLRHGRQYEAVAIAKYEELTMQQVTPSGIVIHSRFNHLGGSPDGVVGTEGLVEIKCPFTAKQATVSCASVPYLHEVNGHLTLKQDHDYYYQVMGLLLVTGRQWCDFVVWTFVDCFVTRIHRDDTFIEVMISKLNDFFKEYFKPLLLKRYLYRDTHLF